MSSLLPFGTDWPMHGSLRERATAEYEVFQAWVAGLDLFDMQSRVLSQLLEMMDLREFVEGRAACVTYEAELARRTGPGDSLAGVLQDLISAGLLTSHPAERVFDDNRPGVVFRIRRPGVVLTVEAAGSLWIKDSWLRTNGIRRNP